MKTRTFSTLMTLMLILVSASSAKASLVSYSITGTVSAGDDVFGPNAFNLSTGDTIIASGTFDDSVLAGDGSGTVSFGMGSGNTMTIVNSDANSSINLAASDDDGYAGGGAPGLTFGIGTALADFDFLELGVFDSDFLFFGDSTNSSVIGAWDSNANITVIPVPAAVWLFGSGLLCLAGIVRKKKTT